MTVEQYANLMQRSGEASGIVINPSEQGYLIDRPHLAQLTVLHCRRQLQNTATNRCQNRR